MAARILYICLYAWSAVICAGMTLNPNGVLFILFWIVQAIISVLHIVEEMVNGKA